MKRVSLVVCASVAVRSISLAIIFSLILASASFSGEKIKKVSDARIAEQSAKPLAKQDTRSKPSTEKSQIDSAIIAESSEVGTTLIGSQTVGDFGNKGRTGLTSVAKGKSILPGRLAKLDQVRKDKKDAKELELRESERVSRAISSHSEEIQNCYHRYLKINPDLKGKLIVRILIGKKGNVKQAEIVESTIEDSRFEEQLISIITAWRDLGECQAAEQKVFLQEYIFGD